jgi:hypothetical protein
VIFTDWVVAVDPETQKWHKVHVTVDTEKIAQFFLVSALKERSRRTCYTIERKGIIVEVQR